MTIQKALLVIAGTGVVAGALGTVLGYVIGATMPWAYRAVFSSGTDPDFDPIQVGVGLGCTEGLIGGALIGVAVVAIVTWYDVQIAKRLPGGTESGECGN